MYIFIRLFLYLLFPVFVATSSNQTPVMDHQDDSILYDDILEVQRDFPTIDILDDFISIG